MSTLRFRSPVTRELRPYRGANVPRPSDAGDAFYVTSPFGPRPDGFHGGLDIGNAKVGYPLVAPADGRVLAAGNLLRPWSEPSSKWPSGNFGGLMVVIEHAPGVVSIFAHMRMRAVSAGDTVATGQKVGEIGDTGSAVGQAHVHFGIQAPAAPAGVQSNRTTFGYGLDIDPYPLLAGTPLSTQEDDVNVPADLRNFIRGRVGAKVRLRRDHRTIDGSRVIKPDEAPVPVAILDTVWQGTEYEIAGRKGNRWYFVSAFGEAWFVATPLVQDVVLNGDVLAQVVPLPQADCSAQEATIAQLNSRIARARTANGGARQASEAVEVALR